MSSSYRQSRGSKLSILHCPPTSSARQILIQAAVPLNRDQEDTSGQPYRGLDLRVTPLTACCTNNNNNNNNDDDDDDDARLKEAKTALKLNRVEEAIRILNSVIEHPEEEEEQAAERTEEMRKKSAEDSVIDHREEEEEEGYKLRRGWRR